jgi:hypothetical protein
MAHTDKDDARWFWKDHFHWVRGDNGPHNKHSGYSLGEGKCWCEDMSADRAWTHPYQYEAGIPSWWKKEQRKLQRARRRTMMQRIRCGALDWDDAPIDDVYRRPYYW